MNFGKYALLDAIGKGSIAEVFKAKSFGAEGFEKLLAIKKIDKKVSADETFGQLFIKETQEALLLNHANIIQVFDLGKVDDQYYLAMELLQGLTLQAVVRECRLRGRMPPLALAAFIAAETAKGLDFAHRKRGRNLKPLDIVHRDITAVNLLLSAEGEVKISDFGLAGAKEAVADLIIPDRKPLYISPEQAEEKAVDRRSDVFSVGVILYEMIGPGHPFTGVSRDELSKHIQEKKFAAPSSFLKTDEEKELADIVERALAFDPQDRFQDAGGLYEALISYIYHTGSRVSTHSVADFLKEILAEEVSVTDYRPLAEEALAVFRSSLVPKSEDADKIAVQRIYGTSSEPPSIAPDSARRDTAVLTVHFKDASPADFNTAQFTEIVENNGGAVVSTAEKHVVAVFGLDLAYGREAEEALDAAFKIRRAAVVHNADKGSQIGIAVWPAAILINGERPDENDPDYRDALSESLAAAEQADEGVVTSNRGRKLSGGAYHFEALELDSGVKVKTPLYHVIGRVPLTESYGRLFGRHENLRAVGAVFTEVSAGKGGVLTIAGPPGIGKTRLIREGQWRLLSSGGDVGWFEVACVEWSRERPFAAVAAMFRSVTALEAVEPPLEIREKTARLRELGVTADEVEAVAALLGAPPVEDEAYYLDAKRILYSAMVHLVQGLSKERTAVLVFDNADDIDSDSFDIFRRLAESFEKLPVLMCLIYRGEVPAILPERPKDRKLEIIPLSKANAEQLAAESMNAEKVESTLSEHIFKITKGNPLFIEAYAGSLVAVKKVVVKDGQAEAEKTINIADAPRGIEEALCDTICGLTAEERTMVSCASLIGQTFNLKLQKHLVAKELLRFRPVLSALKKKRIIYRSSANEFTFTSQLFKDVIYREIPSEERTALHQKVVHALDKVFDGKTDDHAAEMAVHCEAAGDLVSAIEYYTKAGKKAAELNADKTALHFYIKSLDLLNSLPEPQPDGVLAVCLPIGRLAVRANAYELGLEKIQAAEWIAEEVTDKETLIRILLLTSELHAHCEHIVEVDWYMEWAMDLASRLGDRALSFDVLEAAGHVYFLVGDMKQAAPRYRDAIALARKDANIDKDQLITCMAQLAKVEAAAGELETAVKTLAEAEELLTDDSDLLARCEIEQSRGRAFFMAGNFEKAVASQLRLLEIAKEYGLKDHLADTTHMLGTMHLEKGDMAKAFAYLTMSKETADEIGMKHLRSINSLLLGYIDAVELPGTDQVGDMEKLLIDALERDAVWEQLHLLYYLSKIYMEKGRHGSAKEHLQQLIKLGGKVNNRLYHTKAEDLLKEIRVFEKLSL